MTMAPGCGFGAAAIGLYFARRKQEIFKEQTYEKEY